MKLLTRFFRYMIDGAVFIALVAGGIVGFVWANEAGINTVISAMGALVLVLLIGCLYLFIMRALFKS